MTSAPTGVATGVGSLPGDDPREAMAFVVDALPELPHVPELPARGPWADMVGRAAAVLVDLPAEWGGSRWRATARDGRDVRRARATLAEDLDAVEDRLQGYVGPAKLQMCGPLTLAAVLELRGGESAVSDPVATLDLAISLGEGLAGHLLDLRSRVPGVEWVVQLDEPALDAVTAGAIPRSSGWGSIAALSDADAARVLTATIQQVEPLGPSFVVHSCASAPNWGVLTARRGATAISVDLTAISLADSASAMEEWLDSGGVLWLGVDPEGSGPDGIGAAYAQLVEVRSALGVDPERFAEVVAVTPRCGLGGTLGGSAVAAETYAGVRTLMHRLQGGALAIDMEGG